MKSINNSSYRQILRSTSIFGGVQVINVVISLFRFKFLAVFLGPGGVGIIGLYTSALQLITGIIDLGASTSGVRSVSAAIGDNNINNVRVTLAVIKRLAWITGCVGTAIVFFFSGYLSKVTFGSDDYSFGLKCLSLTLLLVQLTNSNLVILQGMRKLGQLAKANLIGNLLGVIFSLPLFYFFGSDGIVPAILVSSVFTFVVGWFYSRQREYTPVRNLSHETFFIKSKEIIGLGVALSASNILVLVCGYVFKIYLVKLGGVIDVGYYNAGYSIVNTYVGMVFTAMATDFFPRLSSTKDPLSFSNLVNQQGEIALLIMGPLLIILVTLVEQVVTVLYSTDFLTVVGMLKWCILGLLFKALSWPVGFILLSKGESKIFFLSEFIANMYMLAFNLIGYYFWGLEGVGVSFLAAYMVYFAQILLIARTRYAFRYGTKVILVFCLMLASLLAIVVFSFFLPIYYYYAFGAVLFLVASVFSVQKINDQMPIIQTLRAKFGNRKKHE